VKPDLERKDHAHHRQADHDQHPAEFRQPPLKRRGLGAGGLKQAGDPTEFRRHACRYDHRHSMACRHHRAGVDHRAAVTERRCFSHLGGGVFLHRHTLAGQG
jgi:hypothetical protein